ncbi:hypothetical protein FB45DRAFT_987489 [Roridomyces roridus]|uniref:Uncharacterized protein n=1 Tax=Roridomyces roridus TaxID=1738132 RepID=A0AAD7FU08_9AGAR|nr:hypothetical protein FB45DRAFT_987489 [Roridomyces roridus]
MSTAEKIVLVTGANKGIGLEIAKQLASLEGHHVLLGSRDAEQGVKASLTSNLSPSTSPPTHLLIASAVETVKSKYGRLDILINNSGILQDFGGVPPTRALFEETFAVNAFGAALTTEAFIPLLEQSPAARVVFVSSDLGSLTFRANPEGRTMVYRSSKAAMNMIALAYAARFTGEQGWKVNVHNPGCTKTDLNDHSGLGTLGPDGETGTYSEKEGAIPW